MATTTDLLARIGAGDTAIDELRDATGKIARTARVLTAALTAVLDVGPCLRDESDSPWARSRADGWDNARAAVLAAIDTALAANA